MKKLSFVDYSLLYDRDHFSDVVTMYYRTDAGRGRINTQVGAIDKYSAGDWNKLLKLVFPNLIEYHDKKTDKLMPRESAADAIYLHYVRLAAELRRTDTPDAKKTLVICERRIAALLSYVSDKAAETAAAIEKSRAKSDAAETVEPVKLTWKKCMIYPIKGFNLSDGIAGATIGKYAVLNGNVLYMEKWHDDYIVKVAGMCSAYLSRDRSESTIKSMMQESSCRIIDAMDKFADRIAAERRDYIRALIEYHAVNDGPDIKRYVRAYKRGMITQKELTEKLISAGLPGCQVDEKYLNTIIDIAYEMVRADYAAAHNNAAETVEPSEPAADDTAAPAAETAPDISDNDAAETVEPSEPAADDTAAPAAETVEPPVSKTARGPVPEKTFVDTTIQGRGWHILFDGSLQKTRLIFDGQPTRAALDIVEKYGFYHNRPQKSYNKKLSFKAYRAALAMSTELFKVKAVR